MTKKELFWALFTLLANLQIDMFIQVAENNFHKVHEKSRVEFCFILNQVKLFREIVQERNNQKELFDC